MVTEPEVLEAMRALLKLVCMVAATAMTVGVGAPASRAASLGQRFSGATRFETARLANEAVFATDEGDAIILARGDDFADALTGSFYAGFVDSLLLFTYSDGLPPATREAIDAYNPGLMVLLGGEAAISSGVEQTLRDQGREVRRLAGATRFGTAREVVGQTDLGPELLLVNGRSFADAVSSAPRAFHAFIPVAPVETDELPGESRSIVEYVRPSRIYVMGGQQAVSDAVVEEAVETACQGVDPDCVEVRRIAGPNRFATSAAFASFMLEKGPETGRTVNLARGDIFPDALAAGILGGRPDPESPTLLVTPDELPAEARAWLQQHAEEIDTVNVLGSPDAVSDDVWNEAKSLAD